MTNTQLSVMGSGGETGDIGARTYLPQHYCGQCMALVYGRDDQCLQCERRQPEFGWSQLQNSGDPWLGRIMKERYLITRRLGKGASAMVYEAESLKISRQFAIKVVDLSATEGDRDPKLVRARIHREIEAISRLRSPHTVPLFEVLQLSETCMAVVMNYIDGCTLASLLREEGPLQWRRALRLLRQMAVGVHDAHQCGMIHRDLKPANIMIRPMSAGDEFVHVLDYGIVWIDDGVEVTRGFVGTPLYSSPEQAMGDEIDCRSDIYALGAILFEMLTGRPPFRSDNVIEVLRMHVRKRPPTLAEVSETTSFPPQVQHLIERMLSKSREARPANLEEVIDAIDDLLDPYRDVEAVPRARPAQREPSDQGRTAEAQNPATAAQPLPALQAYPAVAKQDVQPCHASLEADATAPGLGLIESVSKAYETRDKEALRFSSVTIETLSNDPIFSEERSFCGSGLGREESFFESDEHDATGPKAAIFYRPPSGQHRRLRN